MLSWLKNRRAAEANADRLYGAVVASALAPTLFRDGGVPDTSEARTEMLLLHLALVLERLDKEAANSAELARALVERFVTDVDDQLREMGVGDLAVPKKVKRAAAALRERLAVLRAEIALSAAGSTGTELPDLLEPLAGFGVDADHLTTLRSYLSSARRHLAAVDLESLASGRFDFGPPVAEPHP